MTRHLIPATAVIVSIATALALGCHGGAGTGAADAGTVDDASGSDVSVADGRAAKDPDGGTASPGEGGTPVGPCGGSPVFCDDYTTSSLASAYATYHGTWTRGAGSYTVTDEVAWERARATLSSPVTSFDVTIQGATDGDSGLGIVYGASASADDGYAVLVHPAQFQGVYLKRLVPGQADVEITSAPLPPGFSGTPLTLRVARKGAQVTVWLDGMQVLQSSDAAMTLQGRLGLLVSDTNLTTTDAGAPSGARFTLFRVDTESGPGTPPSDGGSPCSGVTCGGHGTCAVSGGAPSCTCDAGYQPSGVDCVLAAPGSLTYMVGYGGSSTSNATIAQAEATFGRPMDMVTDGVTVDSFQYGPFSSSNGRPLGKVLIFEMLSMSWDSNQGLTDMGQAASGAYDGVYTQMAQAIAASGMPIVSVRPGHEMNGNWYPWSAVSGNTHNATPANYIASFRHIAQIIRKYNPSASIEWCTAMQPNASQWSGSSYTPLDYWVGAYDPVTNPGGADVISMDFYEGDLGTDFNSNILGGQFGLDWLVDFAKQNGVAIGLSEVATGLGNSPGQGGGCPCSNDGAFMQHLVDWLNGLPSGLLRFFVHSPWAPADDVLSSGNAAIQQVWSSSWGKTHFAGTWWKGPKVPSQP